MKKVIVLLSIVLCYQCKVSEGIAKDEPNPIEIYLLIGQSNMAGRAAIELQDMDSINNVLLFTGDEERPWEKAANPLNKYSTVRKRMSMQKLGPGYGFALEMAKSRSEKDIRLVVNAKGGTSIDKWKPGEMLYNEAINQARKALNTGGILKGVIWHQGESNARTYKSYMFKVTELIESLRKDFNTPNLPFVAGQLSPDKPHRNNFNEMILMLPNEVKNTDVVTTENTSTIDSTHFDSQSQRLLGQRYAEALLKLIKD